MKAGSAVSNTSARSSGDNETRNDALSISCAWALLPLASAAPVPPPAAWRAMSRSRRAWSKISYGVRGGRGR